MTPSDERKEKAPGVCSTCGELLTVWITPDGTIHPISPHNTCSCDDPALRIVEADDVFEEDVH
ncbi:hypothetical protein E2L06_14230 [Haloterrigena sp. H1]|uniref:hypothetical protein n=1 Tax=Haloterrigena sp. H1 TaxID=2552943 RepID=UPI00110D327B|nr:hypothetical protein [Haloterrigena sp. H1]TMT87683.1 hypothetical protein E2L06_14230 [Haloterrigena sp. H1]